MSLKRWNVKRFDQAAAERLSNTYGIPPMAAKVLCARGITEEQALYDFLSAAPQLGDPYDLIDMQAAVDRIRQAIDEEELICIYGDYDADGITATVILYTYLQSVGADVTYYIPNRETEGYGMNVAAVKQIAKQGVTLIITVDNGISAYEEVKLATSLGMDVVITDHHQPPAVLPQAVAVVDPHRQSDEMSFVHWAGVGVALKLICALEDGASDFVLDQFGDIAAIGTIADIVPMVGENRQIVRHGLRRIEETDNPGLAALLELCGLSDKKLTADMVAFMLAPKLNAVGRIGDPQEAVQLLICEDEEEGSELSANILAMNQARKEREEVILADIRRIISLNPSILHQRILVISGENWHHGVIGIVCARIMEEYGKPCILISRSEEGEARASARSVEGFSIIQAISACSQYLTRYGGHDQAAGFSLMPEEILTFTEAIEAYAKKNFLQMPPLSLSVDLLVDPRELTVDNIKSLEILEPFGCRNERPILAMPGAVIQQIIPLAQGKHTRLQLSKNGTGFSVLWFGAVTAECPYRVGETVDICFTGEVSSYRGAEQIALKLKDIKPSVIKQDLFFQSKARYEQILRKEPIEPKILSMEVPSREEIGTLYRYLRENRGYQASAELLYAQFSGQFSFCKLMLALQVMADGGLITGDFYDRKMHLSLLPVQEKINLESIHFLQLLRNMAK